MWSLQIDDDAFIAALPLVLMCISPHRIHSSLALQISPGEATLRIKSR